MASCFHPHPPWMRALKTSKPDFSPFQLSMNHLRTPPFKSLVRFSSSSTSPNADDSSSMDSEQNQDESKPDRVSLAFSRALQYKKSLRLNDVQETGDVQAEDLSRNAERAAGIGNNKSGNGGLSSDDGEVKQKMVSESVRTAIENATDFEKSKGMAGGRENNGEKGQETPGNEDGKKEIPEAVRIAMKKAKEYKENEVTVSSIRSARNDEELPWDENGKDDASEAFRIAMEKAKEYKKNKGTPSSGEGSERNEKLPGPGDGSKNDEGNGILKDKLGNKELKLSKIDFMGLDFSEKKQQRGLPPGLVPVPDPFLGKELPEVEILVGDASKFGNAPSSEPKPALEDEPEGVSDLYKPKVSTWGVFPRPSNISKTFGGGRNIHPGEALEREDVRASKEARTKQLLATYKAQIGLNINPKLKIECEKAMRNGDELMDVGRLKDALPYYQKVMEEMPFQTELHGLAALQWAICLDSLSRSDEAQVMYKKLQSHPNAQVSKKARQFAFSFEAMEMMKVRRSAPRNPDYQTYFDAFVQDKTKYTSNDSEPEEGALTEALPYIVFLVSPILIVLLIAASHGA